MSQTFVCDTLLIGDRRSQSLDLQRDALQAAGVDAVHAISISDESLV